MNEAYMAGFEAAQVIYLARIEQLENLVASYLGKADAGLEKMADEFAKPSLVIAMQSWGDIEGGGPAKEYLRIVPTEDGFDIVIPEDITLTEAATRFIETCKQIVTPVWTSVSDALPEEDQVVLLFNRLGDSFWIESGTRERMINNTTHWMPMVMLPW